MAQAKLPAVGIGAIQELKSQSTMQFVTFYYGKHFLGLPIDVVIEINRSLEITPVPLAADYVAGIVNLRGHILTAIDLGLKIGVTHTKEHEKKKGFFNIIMGNREEPISLLVERIGDVMTVSRDKIEPPPEILTGIDRRYVKYICKLPGQLLTILDAEAVQSVN